MKIVELTPLEFIRLVDQRFSKKQVELNTIYMCEFNGTNSYLYRNRDSYYRLDINSYNSLAVYRNEHYVENKKLAKEYVNEFFSEILMESIL